MSKKRIILSDSSLNRYGYRVLTSGLLIEAFKANPIMLYMHYRDEGSPIWGNYKAIGHWEDIQLNDDELSAIPVFDDACELSREIHAKYDAGTYNAASIGIRIIATSANKDLLVPGQTRETVTESELMEASIVDIPANANAVRLYTDSSNSAYLAAGMDTEVVPELKLNHSMKFKKSWKALLSFFKVSDEIIGTAELSAEQLDQVDAELARLSGENTTKDGEIATLTASVESKDQEIATLTTSVESKDQEIAALKIQVENLKKLPASQGATVAPASEGNDDDTATDTLAAFSNDNEGDHNAIVQKILDEGL